jgi:tagaturonate reductase
MKGEIMLISQELLSQKLAKRQAGAQKLQLGYPVKVLQFGEGNFLRAFVDWMLHEMNRRELFGGRALVVQPLDHGTVDQLNQQDGLYTLLLRGVQGGEVKEERQVIQSVAQGINPYQDWPGFLDWAKYAELEVIVSNTTEAGIAYLDEPQPTDACPSSYPAKLLAFLQRRFEAFDGSPESGLMILPCELIDKNGTKLKQVLNRLAADWGLSAEFMAWLDEHNTFFNTLVDRIVPGYPAEEAEEIQTELGYEDKLLVAGEIFHLWVIEGPDGYQDRLPLTKAGLNVVWTDDLSSYRERKVRVLNGLHTSMISLGLPLGLETVREAVEHPLLGEYLKGLCAAEILPHVNQPPAERQKFADEVMERFANPHIRHLLADIALNSVAKFKTRCLPSLLDHYRAGGGVPKHLALALASLLKLYKPVRIEEGRLFGASETGEYSFRDDPGIIKWFEEKWAQAGSGDLSGLAREFLSNTEFWGEDLSKLPGLTEAVGENLNTLLQGGASVALSGLLDR